MVSELVFLRGSGSGLGQGIPPPVVDPRCACKTEMKCIYSGG